MILRVVFALLSLSSTLLAQSVEDPRLRAEIWASGLNRPTCFTFIGVEDLLVFEKDTGRVLRMIQGSVVGTVLDLDVSVAFSRGGLGIVKDPDFDDNGFIYVYYGATSEGVDGGAWTDNRLERYRFDGTDLVEPSGPLITFPFDPAQVNSHRHNGGVLRFGPDGMIYGQVGDLDRGRFDNPRIEQNTSALLSSMVGGIFRIHPDGTIPSDNPFVGHASGFVHPWWVYGFRNSFGMDFDSLTGELWFGDNGSTNYDELNRAVKGMNGGWALIAGPDSRDATYDENGHVPFDEVDLISLDGSVYRDPELSLLEPVGIAAVCFLGSKRFPEDTQDRLLFGDQNYERLYMVGLDASRTGLSLSGGLSDGVVDNATERDSLLWATDFGTTPDLQVGPDGYLYSTDFFRGRIHRIRPWVDLFEPTEMDVLRGRLQSGGLAELERSDDQRLVLGSSQPVEGRVVRELETSFHLHADNPIRLDVVLESRADVPARQRLSIFHVPSGTWRCLDSRTVGGTDQSQTVADVAVPHELIDPGDGRVRVRVRHERADTLRGAPSALSTEIDQVRLLITWP